MPMDRSLSSVQVPKGEFVDSTASRRVEHSSMGYTRRRDSQVGQPQDGSPAREALRLVSEFGSRGSLLPSEPDDAAVTGSTRSLMRRLMGLNIAARPFAPTPMPVGRVSAPHVPLPRTA